MITSSSNSKIKKVRRLQSDRRFRQRERQFVVEGERWIGDLLAAGRSPVWLFYSESWQQKAAPPLWPLPADWASYPVSDRVMDSISDVETAPGVLAVVELNVRPLPARPTLLLLLDRIQNPGNMGTMLRTAAAVGVDGVLVEPTSVDIVNPKVVRAAMGAQLRLPIELTTLATAERLPVDLYYADANAPLPYCDVDWRQPSGLIVGNEAHGVDPQLRQIATGIGIPMANRVESLNAATAAAVILFEAARQRGFGRDGVDFGA